MSTFSGTLRYQWGRVVRRATGRDIPDAVLEPRWERGGRIPWAEGYLATRRLRIAEALADARLLDDFAAGRLIPTGYGLHMDERLVEYPWVFSQLPEGDRGRLLDAGSTFNYLDLLDHPRVSGRQLVICTLAPEAQFGRPNVSYIYDDLRNCCLRDAAFDTVVSISTLEHIGLDNTYYTNNPTHAEVAPDCSRAVRELRRLLAPGGVTLITVPFGRPDNLGWLQVFNSAGIDKLVADFGARLVQRRFYLYTPEGWRVAEEAECREVEYFNFAAEPRQLAPDGAAAARAVACLRFEA